MYNFKRTFLFVLLFCVVPLSWFCIERFQKVSFKEEEASFIIAYKDRFWFVSDSGRLLYVAAPTDLIKKAFVNQVEVSELTVSQDSMKIINIVRDILENPYITEIRLRDKCAVLLKGVVLHFDEWSDLITHVDKLDKAIKFMEPRSEYFLSSSGLMYKLRGDGNAKR